MSSYLTIKYNEVCMACVSRSNKLYTYCRSAPFDEWGDLTLEDLNDALDVAKEDKRVIEKEMEHLNWLADRVSTDYSTLLDIRDSLTDAEESLKECTDAINIIEVLRDIYEMNSKDRDLLELGNDFIFTAGWMKD